MAFPDNCYYAQTKYGEDLIKQDKDVWTKYNEDLIKQDEFSYMNTMGYVQREEYEKLRDYLQDSDNRICLITSDEGFGKTSILSALTEELKQDYCNKNINVYSRFCGQSPLSSDMYSLWECIIIESMSNNEKRCFYSYPFSIFELTGNINRILDEIARNGDSIIIIDSFEKLEKPLEFLKLLDKLPKNLKLIISINKATDEYEFNSKLEEIKKSEIFYSIEIGKLNYENKKDIIKTHLDNYSKELSEYHINTICTFKGSDNPLYLKILLFQLIGLRYLPLNALLEKDELNRIPLEEMGQTPKEAFYAVIERFEEEDNLMYVDKLSKLIFTILEINYNLSLNYLCHKVFQVTPKYKGNEKEIKSRVMKMFLQIEPFVKINYHTECNILFESLKEVIKERYG